MKTIGDVVQYSSDEEVAKNLLNCAVMLEAAAGRIRNTLKRSERNMMMHNFLVRAAVEMRRLQRSYPKEIDIIAWCTRNLFEMFVTAFNVLESEAELKKWVGQMASDELEIVDGFIGLAEKESSPALELPLSTRPLFPAGRP